MAVNSATQSKQTCPVVSLGEDAWQVGGQRVDHDDDISPPRVPQEEDGGARNGEPVTKLPSTRLSKKPLQVLWIGADQRSFAEPARKPARPVGEQAFPSPDGDETLVESTSILPCTWCNGAEPHHWHLRKRPGKGELQHQPTAHIQNDNPACRQLNRHGLSALSRLPVAASAASTT